MRNRTVCTRFGGMWMIMLIVLLAAVSCKSGDREKTAERSPGQASVQTGQATAGKAEPGGQAIRIPSRKSALDGWQGVKVKKCGSACCELVFPGNFGLRNKQQLMALKDLVNKDMEHDVDCVMQVSRDALNQLRFLAAEKQDRDAALMLLAPSRHGGFDLDGELAEECAGDYQLTVLEKYQDLGPVLDKTMAEDLSTSICSWAEVLGEAEGAGRVKKLIPYLKSRNLDGLARLFAEKCKAVL